MKRRSFLKTMACAAVAAVLPVRLTARPRTLLARSGDDLPALMDSLADGGTLYVRGGVYHFTRPIMVPKGKALDIEGAVLTAVNKERNCIDAYDGGAVRLVDCDLSATSPAAHRGIHYAPGGVVISGNTILE